MSSVIRIFRCYLPVFIQHEARRYPVSVSNRAVVKIFYRKDDRLFPLRKLRKLCTHRCIIPVSVFLYQSMNIDQNVPALIQRIQYVRKFLQRDHILPVYRRILILIKSKLRIYNEIRKAQMPYIAVIFIHAVQLFLILCHSFLCTLIIF